MTGLRAAAKRWAWLGALAAAVAVPAQAWGGEQVPFKGADAGTFAFGSLCGPTSITVDIRGSGTAAHLGRYTYEAHECFDTVELDYDGVFMLTAADGDTIVGTYSGDVVDIVGAVGEYEQEAVVTGGTGRFAGASGGFDVSGEANLASLDYTQELSDGAITSPGGAKR